MPETTLSPVATRAAVRVLAGRLRLAAVVAKRAGTGRQQTTTKLCDLLGLGPFAETPEERLWARLVDDVIAQTFGPMPNPIGP